MTKPILPTVVVVAALVLCTTVSALEVLQPSCVVETYASYPCPVSLEAYGMPRGLAFALDGNLYLTQLRSYPDRGSVYRVSPDSTAVEWLTSFATPRRIVWTGGSAFGNYLYLTDGTSNALFRVGLDGSVSAFATIAGGVHSLGLDRQGLYGGHLYVATRAPDHVYAVSLSGQVTLFSNFPGSVPSGHLDLTFDPGTNWGQRMYVALERPAGQSGVGGVFSIAPTGQATPIAASIVTAWTVAIAPAGPFCGDLYVCGKLRDDDPSYSLWRVKPDGSLTQYAVPTIGSNLHNFTFAPDGTLLVPEFSFAEQTVVISRIIADGGTLAPSLLVEPVDQTVLLGQPAQFTVVARGATPLSYQWQFQGTNLSGATGARLALATAQFSDAGGYRLVASNAFGAVTSRVAVLTVLVDPVIEAHPQGQTVVVGSNVRLGVTASGPAAPFSYEWYFQDTALPAATNSVLMLTRVDWSHAGRYWIVVRNAYASVTSHVATLTVIGPSTQFGDDFEAGISPSRWVALGGLVLATNYGGSVSGTHSLWFGGDGTRLATTRPLDTILGGRIEFSLRFGNDEASPWWNLPELPAEGIVLEYSINAGRDWVNVATYDTSTYTNWTFQVLSIPAGAQSSNTLFRWRQLQYSGPAHDHWALDDVAVIGGPILPVVPAPPSNGIACLTNPIRQGQDPTVTIKDGIYHLVQSDGCNLRLWRSSTLGGFATATNAIIWSPGCSSLWAPELHWISNHWFLYYTLNAGGGTRVHVAESQGSNAAGPYTYRGVLFNSYWNIDGSVFTWTNGQMYFLCSALGGDPQSLYIAPMSNPYTLSTPLQSLSYPNQWWETVGGSVNEGPWAIQREGQLFIVYSASGCWTDDYTLGLLALTGPDPLDYWSWTKTGPMFLRQPGVYGPGHNSVVLAPDGQWWNVYHANNNSGEGCGGLRRIRAQRMAWRADGMPDFGTPTPIGSIINEDADFLVARYPLTETSGGTASNAAPCGPDATLRGAPTWTNPGLKLNGTTDYVRCGAELGNDVQHALTLTAWIKPDAFGQSCGLITKGSNAAPYALQAWDDGSLRFTANFGSPAGGIGSGSWNSTAKMSAGQWHHVAVTYDGARVRFYLNGLLDAQQPAVALRFGVVNEPLFLGVDFQGGDENFRGTIRDARVYGRALSADEIAAFVTVSTDFSARQDPPLFKKFGVMNSGLVDYTHYARDAGKLGLAQLHSQRIDLSFGKTNGFGPPIIRRAPDALQYDWPNLDAVTHATLAAGVWPYWTFCYQPEPLQQSGDWRSPPTDLAAWREVARAFAEHFRSAGLRLGFHEVWNEPDFPAASGGLFSGTRDQYLEMYCHAALGFREGNLDAVVGGPALAYDTNWISPFLEFVRTNDLPLDFFSFHATGGAAEPGQLQAIAQARLQTVRDAMGSGGEFVATEIHLNENYPFGFSGGRPSVPSSSLLAAPQMLDDFAFFLGFPDLTSVHIAQGLAVTDNPDAEISLLDFNGNPNSSFFAFAFYGDLPVERCAASAPAPLGVFAGANAEKAGVLVWNFNTNATYMITLPLANVPWFQTRVSVFQVDGTTRPALVLSNGTWTMVPTYTFTPDASMTMQWRFAVPPNGLTYLKIEPLHPAAAPLLVADIIRLHRYYPNRGGDAYAEFDRHTWTAHLGLGDRDDADALVGVCVTNLPARVQVEFQTHGALQDRNANTLLGLRVDYLSTNGAYTKAVLFHDGLCHTDGLTPLPWGGTNLSPFIVAVPSLSNFVANLPAHAPAGWNGRALLSFEMRNTGRGSRANIRVRSATDTPPSNAPTAITLTAPANFAHLTVPLTVTATVFDEDSEISQVEFFANGWKIGEVHRWPYSIRWTNAIPGPYVLGALATDTAGNCATSHTIQVLVDATLIAPGSAWKYHDRAVDLGTIWRATDYDDSTWSNGIAMLGFGDADGHWPATVIASNHQATTYLRHAFTITDPAGFTSLTLRLVRDDGAVVYLNDAEVWRDNMPTNRTILYNTSPLVRMEGPDECRWWVTNCSPSPLRLDTNVLAVELHQRGYYDPDLAFDFSLSAAVRAEPAALQLTAAGGGYQLSWPASSGFFTLYGTTNLSPPIAWQRAAESPLLSNGMWTVRLHDLTNHTVFYRLQSE